MGDTWVGLLSGSQASASVAFEFFVYPTENSASSGGSEDSPDTGVDQQTSRPQMAMGNRSRSFEGVSRILRGFPQWSSHVKDLLIKPHMLTKGRPT